MTEQITPELFDHLILLASLELTPEEGEYLRKQLNEQLKSIDELLSIPIDPDTPLAVHGVPYSQEISQSTRADEWQTELNPAEILRQAPQIEDGYIVVPEIPHTEL